MLNQSNQKRSIVLIVVAIILFYQTSAVGQNQIETAKPSKAGIDIVDVDKVVNVPKVFNGVEVMPSYPGGEEELVKFIREHLIFPKSAIEKGVQGRVMIRFVVDNTGKVANVEVIKGLDPECDKEAVRVVKNMPNWTPGSQDGKNVSVYYVLPIVFKIPKENEGTSIIEPLLVVNAIQVPYSTIGKINSESIQSIKILNEAEAIAKFGERAKNGAILITTK